MKKSLASLLILCALIFPAIAIAQTSHTVFLPAMGKQPAPADAPHTPEPPVNQTPTPQTPEPETPVPPDPNTPTPGTLTPPVPATLAVSGVLRAHFIDVAQGDSTLLTGPDFTFLIDAGRHDRNDVVPYLQQVNVHALDLLVGTHPHADHIGQMDKVLETYPVGEVWMSGDESTSLTFERVIDAINASDAAYHEPRAGEVYDMGAAVVEVLHPAALTGDLNGNSIVLRILFDGVTFLFTGDAEAESEAIMLQSGRTLQADVLKVGHHGSRTSSTQAFLDAVSPTLALWSAGLNNTYGHPHPEVMQRFADMDIETHGTADCGTLVVKVVALSLWLDAENDACDYARLADHVQTGVGSVNAQLHASADSSAPVVEAVLGGTTLWALGTNDTGDWIYARMASGAVGWLHGGVVDGVNADTLPVVVAPPPTEPEPTEPEEPIEPEPTEPEPEPEPEEPPIVECVNINTASHEELQLIIHIGPERATQLIKLREQQPFASVDDMTRISGIGPSRLADIQAEALACV